jgi:hypothetical protein
MGNQLTVSVAWVVMLKWDRQFLLLWTVNKVDLHLYRRYIDDQLGVYYMIASGYRWSVDANAIVFQEYMVNEDKDPD